MNGLAHAINCWNTQQNGEPYIFPWKINNLNVLQGVWYFGYMCASGNQRPLTPFAIKMTYYFITLNNSRCHSPCVVFFFKWTSLGTPIKRNSARTVSIYDISHHCTLKVKKVIQSLYSTDTRTAASKIQHAIKAKLTSILLYVWPLMYYSYDSVILMPNGHMTQ